MDDSVRKELPDQEDDHTETCIKKESYVTVLKEEDIWRLMENMIQMVTVLVTSLSKAEATLVLSHFHWDTSEFGSKWFDDTSVRERVGVFDRSLHAHYDDKEFYCGLCNELHQLENSASVSCGHRVCTNCWTSHIKNIFNETQELNVWLKCPYVRCNASVGRDMIERFSSEEEKTKYDRYLLKSYVQDSKSMKLCPRTASGRSCGTDLIPSGNSSVYCVCLLKFCWNCSKDVHSPVDCETAAKWLELIISGYHNSNRPLANTVPCPKCKQKIAKDEYLIAEEFSLKMKCVPCNYKFCWLCRDNWTKHSEGTCDNDAVPYEESQETSQQWRMEEFSADKFEDCYKSWKSNDLLMQNAEAKLEQLRNVVIPELSNIQLPTVHQLEFIIEAELQIIESLRILKWSYAYQYYLPEGKQNLLKIKQVYVKFLLDKVNDCIETKLPRFLNAEGSSDDFNAFGIELTRLTSTTRQYNETLIRDLEDGLANDVRKVTINQG